MLLSHFNRWCSPARLYELIVLEQLKNLIPQCIVTHVSEQKVTTVLKVAELADNFVLTHKGNLGEVCLAGIHFSTSGSSNTFRASRGKDKGGKV